jgi:hypothetical protein
MDEMTNESNQWPRSFDEKACQDELKSLRALRRRTIEAEDRILFLESLSRRARHGRKGFDDPGLFPVLDFINGKYGQDTALGTAQKLVRACIRDLMGYGRALYRIERKERASTIPLRVETLARLPEMQKANKTFDSKHFLAAHALIKNCDFKMDRVVIGPPMFFSYSMRISAGSAKVQVFNFLQLCGRLDPRLWAVCEGCREFFLRKRARETTSHCSNFCRYARHNRKTARRKQKEKVARDYLKGRSKYRG